MYLLFLLAEDSGNYNGGTMDSEHVIQTRNFKRDTNLSAQTEGKILVRDCVDTNYNKNSPSNLF